MTVHVHKAIAGISYGDHSHHQPAELAEDQRTWSFTCTPKCEKRILEDEPLSSRTADTVAPSGAEKRSDVIAEKLATKSWGELMGALKGLAKEQARERLAGV